EDRVDDSREEPLLFCIDLPDRIGRADLPAANCRRIEQPARAAALRTNPEAPLAIDDQLRGAAHDLAHRPRVSNARNGVSRAVDFRKPDRAVLRFGELPSLGG